VRPTLIVTPRSLALALALTALFTPAALAQSSSSSSSSSSSPDDRAIDTQNPAARPRAAQIEAGGAAVTLETSEPLFDVAAALNACGYDADLDISAPVRQHVRDDMNAALAASEDARTSRDALCAYITQHHLNDTGLDIGQYVSLALYLSPPPELTPNVSELDLPPQAAAVVNVLTPLRTFAEAVNLHYIWLQHRAEYEALAARVHDPMTQMILNTNIYLHQPVSTYDGRRFLVLLEPMLSPALTNARVYGSDYIIVTSPDNSPATLADGSPNPVAPVRIDQIRHIYLHYVVEPFVYSRGSAMERIQPMLRSVQDAPLEFFYKSDVAALITECLIKAIEARTYVIPDATRPRKPAASRGTDAMAQYEALKVLYDKQTALERDVLVHTDESQGWALTGYFYAQLGQMERNGDGLRDEIAPMIYGMNVDSQRKHAEDITWAKSVPPDPLRPTTIHRDLTPMDKAELALMHGDTDTARSIAEQVLTVPAKPGSTADRGTATYILARIDLMQGDPEKAVAGFSKALTLSKDPRTLAWSHIYLGRLYDTETDPERPKAIAEYQAALATRDSRPDTKQAADSGLAHPFALPKRPGITPAKTDADDPANDKDFDPTGKAEKNAYHPTPTPPTSPPLL
jgi:tetratricopeptide (TPR) repeat protein